MTHSGRAVDRATERVAALSVLVCHRDEMVLLGCRAVLRRQSWVSRCLIATDLDQACGIAAEHDPRLVLLHGGPAGHAASAVASVRTAAAAARIVLISEHGRFTEADARTVGAAAVITSPIAARELIAAARTVAAGRAPGRSGRTKATALSQREAQVLSQLAMGATNREVGERLLLAPDTIKNHVSRAYRKLGARNRLEAVNRARDLGFIS